MKSTFHEAYGPKILLFYGLEEVCFLQTSCEKEAKYLQTLSFIYLHDKYYD